MRATTIDLVHLGLPGAIAAYLVDTPEGPAVVDPGPPTTLERLEAGLEEVGVPLSELRHLLLTHVHLDHAGGAGWLARGNPDLLVHVHEEGAPHMADPARLVASTRRVFGEAHDRLWGEVAPVPEGQLRPWRPGAPAPLPGIRALPTPGHIGHHLAYLDEEGGTLFAGDALGIILAPGAPTHPPTPPPAVDVEAWRDTLDAVASLAPERAAVTHFGVHGRVSERSRELRRALDALEARVEEALVRGEEGGDAYGREVRDIQAGHAERERVERYFDTFSATKDWAGMVRYVQKRKEAEGR